MTLKPIPITLNIVQVMAACTLEKVAKGERAPKERYVQIGIRIRLKVRVTSDSRGPHLSTLSCQPFRSSITLGLLSYFQNN